MRGCCLFLALVLTTLPADAAGRPNVVFVLADDLGWRELGCYGNGFNQTRHLDRLARDGMRFTQAYAAAPVCSPYRAAFLTGQYPARIGILDYLRPNSANALSTRHVTLPEMLGRSGYATGMIGKWHLSGYAFHGAEHEIKPRSHGFAWDFAREVKGVGNGANFWPYVFRKQPIRWIDIPENRLGKNEFLVDRMNHEAVDFIERNKDRPFFLYLSHYAPHSILNGKPELVEKYRRKHRPGKSTRQRCYLCQDHGHPGDALNHWAGDHNPHLAAMLESIDDGIGMIRDRLEKLGLSEKTIFVFTSDNGGETNVTSNAPLRGGKSELYEGGLRVPLIVHWPGQVPAGAVSHKPTVNVDFYPTLLEAAGIERDPAHVVDGRSTLSTWKGSPVTTKERELYWHYPLDRPHFLGGRSAGAIRDGDWKLIEFFDTGESELYSLAADPSERHDRSAEHPDLVRSLKAKLVAWRNSVGARRASAPLLAEPRQLYFADHFSPGQVSSRWAFSGDWSVEGGVLLRGKSASRTTRIFLKQAEYRDAVIRFDFQFRQARDIRLVTGGNGSYNAVVHIRRDHFYVQTALDKSGPYFPYRHGECACIFEPNRWYTMTVEFIGDQLVAHVDRDHLVYARHPILDKQRRYLALQVDQFPAAFDNVQVLSASKHREQARNLEHIRLLSGRYPVKKTLEEQLAIQKRNAHERLYRGDADYRRLVKQVDALDAQNKRIYPDVFRSHKEFRKEIAASRKKLHAEDPRYKALLFAMFRSRRAIDEFLIARKPEVADLPDSRRLREIEQLNRRFQEDRGYLELVARRDAAQRKLEKSYPKLFLTNQQITEFRRTRRQALQNDATFKKRVNQRATAWRARQTYLFEHDKQLAELQRRVTDEGKP